MENLNKNKKSYKSPEISVGPIKFAPVFQRGSFAGEKFLKKTSYLEVWLSKKRAYLNDLQVKNRSGFNQTALLNDRPKRQPEFNAIIYMNTGSCK